MTLGSVLGQWEPYAGLLGMRDLEELLRLPLEVCTETPRRLFPSIELGPDGPALRSVFFTTETLLGEVAFKPGVLTFDFLSLSSIFDYRFELTSHKAHTDAGGSAEYQMAAIHLRHVAMDNFKTFVSYAGPERRAWLESVLTALPVSSVCRVLHP
jgi:hypothetical protein